MLCGLPSAALIRAKCLPIRLVNGTFFGYTRPGRDGMAPRARQSLRPSMGLTARGGHRITQASGPRIHVGTAYDASNYAGSRLAPIGAEAAPGRRGLIVLAIPLSGCGTGALWDKFMAKDDTFVDEPADKLYNEGLYLMNEKKDPKAASKKFEEVDRQHPYSDWARKSLLMSAYAYYKAGDYDSCIGAGDPLRHAASRQPGRGLCAISDRGLALRPDSGHLARPGPHREGDRRAGRGDPQISDLGICDQRQGQDRRRARPARRQGNGRRPLLHGEARLHRPPSTASRPWSPSTRPRGMSRRRCPG